MEIIHQPQNQRFELNIDGHTAYLEYEVVDEKTLDFTHTIVPTELGGRGLGKALAKSALDYAREQGKKVVPSCSFVAGFVSKNPEYQDLI